MDSGEIVIRCRAAKRRLARRMVALPPGDEDTPYRLEMRVLDRLQERAEAGSGIDLSEDERRLLEL